MNGMMPILACIAATVPFMYMTLRSRKINLEKRYRGHQFIMPLAAVILCLVGMISVTKLELGMVKFVHFLSGVSSFIPVVGGILNNLFDSWYSLFKVGYGVQLACNLFIMTFFCTVKAILLPIIKRYWTNWPVLYSRTAGHFYTELGNHSILKQRYAQMRNFFDVMYWTLVGLGWLDCVLAFVYSKSEVFQFPFYPVFGIIVLGEISCFLDGETLDEANIKEGPGPAGNVGVDYSKLMEELKRVFGDRLNLDTEIPRLSSARKLHDWDSELLNGDNLDRITGSYFSEMDKAGETVNPDYVRATQKLMHRENVLIFNPFYHDLTPYLLLPVFHELLNHHSCLVICGRMSNEDDIQRWLHEGIEDVTNLPKLWKIQTLDRFSSSRETPDIGILGFKKLYDLDTLYANKKFFEKTSFIILLEPSNLLGTGQIGLRSVLQYCEKDHKELTYCILDRNVDGLVDAMSHAVRQSITEVIASPVPAAPYCRMLWRAEGNGMHNRILPRISHYLGIGTEIAALAMHEGVSNIHWYSGEKMSLTDLKWNVEQYYSPICRYIHSPAEQSELDVRFRFHNGLWLAPPMSDAFILVEDEFCNVFEMSRTFAARIRELGFINILSENYMLRDYMCDNDELFTNDPKAIPSITPDYARTERNFVMRTLLLMAVDSVSEKDLSKELSLHGCETKFPYETFCSLVEKYTGVGEFQITTGRENVGVGGNAHSKFVYRAGREFVESIFDSALKSAHYVVENEKTDTYPMGNRLLGHIDQVLLPGQFFCYEGKYYQVKAISEDTGIIVRRSADHITGRRYYRQLRDYEMEICDMKDQVNRIRDIEMQICRADIKVTTPGYLELKASNLLDSAILATLDTPRKRKIIYKDVLKISFEDITPEQRFTLCLLMNELFRTLYPNEAGYLVAVTSDLAEDLLKDPMYQDYIKSLVPGLEVSKGDKDSIYCIEDSAIDLGLLVSIERNFQRIMETIADYLDWYLDPARARADAQDEDASQEDGPSDTDHADNMDRSMDRSEPEDQPLNMEQAGTEEIHRSGEATSDVDGEDEELLDDGPVEFDLKRTEYLTFGYEREPEWLDLAGTLEYLRKHHFDDSNLRRSRKKTPEFDDGSNYDPNQPGTHYCDFCGNPLEPGEYDILKDGRERCPACSSEAVKSRRQFKKVYAETLEEMQQIFDIKIECPVKVRMVNARKVNDIPGEKWEPTPRFDGRVLGYAQRSRDGYKLLVENGAPLWKMKSTLVHELTHIWQYINWEEAEMKKHFQNSDERDLNMEGMAVWTEVQYLISMGEKERAIRYKRNRDADPSVYGVGMKRFLSKYPIKEVSALKDKKTPFKKFPPLK